MVGQVQYPMTLTLPSKPSKISDSNPTVTGVLKFVGGFWQRSA